jgi:hypothetical protein
MGIRETGRARRGKKVLEVSSAVGKRISVVPSGENPKQAQMKKQITKNYHSGSRKGTYPSSTGRKTKYHTGGGF